MSARGSAVRFCAGIENLASYFEVKRNSDKVNRPCKQSLLKLCSEIIKINFHISSLASVMEDSLEQNS